MVVAEPAPASPLFLPSESCEAGLVPPVPRAAGIARNRGLSSPNRLLERGPGRSVDRPSMALDRPLVFCATCRVTPAVTGAAVCTRNGGA
jgi:hypothetical protein